MNYYLLKRKRWAGYGTATTFVVIAEDERRAREYIVHDPEDNGRHHYQKEGPDCWLDEKQSTCEMLKEVREEEQQKRGVLFYVITWS